jgi:hypothetical protein
MGNLALAGSTSGAITLSPPAVAGSNTLTLPAVTGNVLTDAAVITTAQGGTGNTFLTANSVLLGNGSSAVQTVPPGASGNVLKSNGTTWTSAAGGGITSITAGTGLSGGTITTSGTIALVTTLGAVGTYGFLTVVPGTAVNPGATIAGSNLYWAGLQENYTNNPYNCTTITHADIVQYAAAPAGTWQAMGYAPIAGVTSPYGTTLFMRIA